MRFPAYKRPLSVPCPRCGTILRTDRGELPTSQRQLEEALCRRCRRRRRLAIGFLAALAIAVPAWWCWPGW